MAKKEFMLAVKQTANRAVFQVKKHSPEILVIGGVVGAGLATAMAFKQGSVISEIVATHHATMDACDEAVENETVYEDDETGEKKVYNEETSKSDKRIVRVDTIGKLAKAAGPTVIVYVASATAILAGLNIMRKRNLALVAAYATVSETFKAYRERVIEEYGEDVDKAMRYGKKEVEIAVLDENGNDTGKTEKINVEEFTNEDYVVYFNKDCPGWTSNMNYNVMQVQGIETYLCNYLLSKTYVYLNEAYESLGIHGTRAGQVAGWIYDPGNPDHNGDNVIKTRMEVVHLEQLDGTIEDAIRIDFNIDGVIVDDPRVFGKEQKHQTIK